MLEEQSEKSRGWLHADPVTAKWRHVKSCAEDLRKAAAIWDGLHGVEAPVRVKS